MNDEQKNLYFNGINYVTGDYGLKPMPPARLARLIQGQAEAADRQELLAQLDSKALSKTALKAQDTANKQSLAELEDKKARQTHLGAFPVKEGVDPTSIAQSGWGVVFPGKMDAQHKARIKEALAPLLALRKEQAGDLYAVFENGRGYRSGERKDQFCKRQKPEVRPGPADPAQMPFYVLLVGSPAEIPYSFQFQLDVMRAVGRIDFGSDYEAYARYAQSVVMAETGQVQLPQQAAFWGAANNNDPATQTSSQWLVNPLVDNLSVVAPDDEIKLSHSWQINSYIGDGQATKSQLNNLLGGDPAQTPALLMTASHGLEVPKDHPQQRPFQGALITQDWGGPGTQMSRDHFFGAEDLTSGSSVLGSMAMFFACYGAGTPLYDQFAQQAFKERAQIASSAFIGALPNKLLSQGMLAVIGHVERAWGTSFIAPGGHLDNQAFITSLRKIMNGEPIGLATDPSFDLRYADLSSNLSSIMEELQYDESYISEQELARIWTANNDARNYVVIGDPAARLPLADEDPETAVRPTITVDLPQSAAPEEKEDDTAAEPTADQPTSQYSGEPLLTDDIAFAFGRERSGLAESLTGFTSQLAKSLNKAAADISSLEVKTYSGQNLEGVGYDYEKKHLIGEIEMRALTRISFDGDVQVCVPQKDNAIDEELWKVHLDMVKEAQANRIEFFKAMTELATKLIDTLNIT